MSLAAQTMIELLIDVILGEMAVASGSNSGKKVQPRIIRK
jgi:hypothetical protein